MAIAPNAFLLHSIAIALHSNCSSQQLLLTAIAPNENHSSWQLFLTQSLITAIAPTYNHSSQQLLLTAIAPKGIPSSQHCNCSSLQLLITAIAPDSIPLFMAIAPSSLRSLLTAIALHDNHSSQRSLFFCGSSLAANAVRAYLYLG